MKSYLPKRFKRFCSSLWTVLILLCFSQCQGGLKQTEYEKVRRANCVTESIFRKSEDRYLNIPIAQEQAPDPYPWQKSTSYENLPFITKEFFRCRGDGSHPSYTLSSSERLFDCNGFSRHSLPIVDQQEHIYPVLIDLLNYLQSRLKRRVIITCGHRCPQHNRYSDPAEHMRTSKHMIGAEVDFYVQGFEKKTEIIVDLLMEYYSQKKGTQNDPEYVRFQRYMKSDSYVSTPPWYNKEVYIKIYKDNEGRDFDNQHPYPYISVQVRWDAKTNQRVTYTWDQAFYSYLRY